MTAIALQARALTTSVRDGTRKKEEANLKVRIAAWKKREKEKAQNAIERLPMVIKGLAENGKSQLVVCVEVTKPFVRLDINDTYKVLSMWDFPSLLESKTPEPGDHLSLYKIRDMRAGARMIARWALKEGFTVHFHKWDNERRREEFVRNYDFLYIDQLVTPVFPDSRHGGWSVEEGFMIAW